MERAGPKLSVRMAYSYAFAAAAFGIVILWLSHVRHGVPLSELLGVGNIWIVFGLGTLAAVVLIGYGMAVAAFVPDRMWRDDGTNASFSRFSYLHIFLVMLIGAVGEELIFRLGIQRMLVRELASVTIGIGAAGALFAVSHVRYLKKPVLLVSIFLCGVVYGWSYWVTGSIWTSVWCHFLVNTVMSVVDKKGLLLPRSAVDKG